MGTASLELMAAKIEGGGKRVSYEYGYYLRCTLETNYMRGGKDLENFFLSCAEHGILGINEFFRVRVFSHGR